MIKKVLKNTAWLSGSGVISKFLFFIQFIMLARFYGPENIGKYTFVFAFCSFFDLLVNLGIRDYVIREVSKDKSKASYYLSHSIGAKMLVGFFMTIIFLISLFFINIDMSMFSILMITYIGSVLIQPLIQSFYSIFQSHEEMWKQSVTEVAISLIVVVLNIFLILNNYPFILIFISFLIGAIVGLVISILFMIEKRLKLFIPDSLGFLKSNYKKIFSFFLPGFLFVIIFQVNLVMVKFLLGYDAVGIYSGGISFTRNIIFLIITFNYALYPKFSYLFKQKKREFFHFVKKGYIILILFLLVLVVSLYTIGEFLIPFLLGPEFISSVSIFKYSLIVIFFEPLCTLNTRILYSVNKEKIIMQIFLLASIISIILNYFLILKFRIIGAVYSLIFTYIFIFLIQSNYIIRNEI